MFVVHAFSCNALFVNLFCECLCLGTIFILPMFKSSSVQGNDQHASSNKIVGVFKFSK